MVNIGNDWDKTLDGEFDKDYYRMLREFLKKESRNTDHFILQCMIYLMR